MQSFNQLQALVKQGAVVHWKTHAYVVEYVKPASEYIVRCTLNDDISGLFYTDGVTTDYQLTDFFTV